MHATATPAQIANFRLAVGDTAFTKDSETADDIGVPAYVAESSDDLICGYHLAIATPDRAAVDPRFLFWAMSSARLHDQWTVLAAGVTRVGLRSDDLGKAAVPVPPLDEQRRIADFLDTETTQIDALAVVRSQQRMLLDDRELAVIRELVSGRDVPGPRCPTGLPWMLDLPDSWDLAPVYAYFDVQLGKMLNAERAGGANLKPYLRNANVHWYSVATDDLAEMSFEPAERRRYQVLPGELLVCEGGAGVAEAAVWTGNVSEIYYQKSLHRCRPTGSLPVEWLMFWLRLAKHTGVFASEGNLATIPHLTGEQLRSHRIPVPPDAQRRVAEIQAALTPLRAARAALDSSERLVTERRQALITAAVTGQLDVTTATGATA